jgi:transposase
MPAPASEDLRQRVVRAYLKGGLTYQQVAERFSVGEASVSRWLRLHRERGDVRPRGHRGGRKRRLGGEREALVKKLVLEHPDWTELEYARALREQYGIDVSPVTVGRAIRLLGYSVKKRPYSPPSAIGPTCSEGASSTTSTSEASPLRVWFLWTKRAPTSR